MINYITVVVVAEFHTSTDILLTFSGRGDDWEMWSLVVLAGYFY